MDLRLLPLTLGLWISTAGTLLVLNQVSYLKIFLWLLALTFLSLTLYRKKRFKFWSAISTKFLVVGFVVGISATVIRIEPLVFGPLSRITDQNAVIQIEGELANDPRRSKSVSGLDLSTRDFGYFNLAAQFFTYRDKSYRVDVPIQVFVSGQNLTAVENLAPGTKLAFSGKLTQAQLVQRVAGKVSVVGDVQVVATPANYQYFATKFRKGLHQALTFASPEVAGLVPGLALGDDSKITSQLENEMKVSGLAHLTAVSGSNVTLLIALVLAFGRKLNFRNLTNYYLALGALAFFVVVVRPQPSVLRASAMGVIMVLALLSKSPKSPLPALTATVILLIIFDPWLSLSYGFSLSVFATGGLLLFAKSLLQSFDRLIPRQIPEWVLIGLVVTISAQIAVFPILIALGSPISVGSLPANLISVPLAGPTMVFGLLAAIVAPVYLPLAKLIAWVATIPAWLIAKTAHVVAGQEWLVIGWPQGIAGVFFAVALISYGIWLKINWLKFSNVQKQLSSLVLMVLLFLIWQPPGKALTNWVPADWQLVSCDVGQGDATVIKVSRSEAVVVDVGGDPELIDQCLRELKVKRIPLLLLTHFHADHVVGLPGVFSGRQVGQIRISPLADPPLTTEFVNQVLQEQKTDAKILAYPEYLKIADLEIHAVWPKTKIGELNSTPNNASVSLLIKVGQLTVLLPGDVEPIAQQGILNLAGQLKVDVLKIPHHGSKFQLPKFAQATSPQLAIVSAGEGNSYGHPAPETIFLYELVGAKVLRTDEHGSIAVIKRKDKLLVSTQK